ncbi:hypothetical protein T440DRAFT_541258 [Plenodomus tracheiphilus IPT5]|uniref:Uncharacterized protein n=1 Tax=Plenodomus tracheiphilus IPT5 TaxID=1408161 RepID=A0A6A7ATB3_9PLEO|nr:hypothetical protein T440DRAFT_541258 [Plenodomus tracheiphilus IPT5]
MKSPVYQQAQISYSHQHHRLIRFPLLRLSRNGFSETDSVLRKTMFQYASPKSYPQALSYPSPPRYPPHHRQPSPSYSSHPSHTPHPPPLPTIHPTHPAPPDYSPQSLHLSPAVPAWFINAPYAPHAHAQDRAARVHASMLHDLYHRKHYESRPRSRTGECGYAGGDLGDGCSRVSCEGGSGGVESWYKYSYQYCDRGYGGAVGEGREEGRGGVRVQRRGGEMVFVRGKGRVLGAGVGGGRTEEVGWVTVRRWGV